LIHPYLPGCHFNPPHTAIVWRQGWHRVEFQFQAIPILSGFTLEAPISGRIYFAAGAVLIGEVDFHVRISKTSAPADLGANEKVTATPYRSIFVSYAHQDSPIVDRLESAYRALGDDYQRDIRLLRCGEKWEPKLLEMIEAADIFQLCWSHAARFSKYVEKEWRHALGQRGTSYIRPTYWETPMPDPPNELADLHFVCLRLD